MKTTKWSATENAALVAAYFGMLALSQAGKACNKAAVRRALIAGPLAARSNGSIEFKLMNVSGVCQSLGLPLLPGYQPASNYQRDLVAAVQAHVSPVSASIAA
jgi:5-methylcytosine-specific restriction protein A